MKGIKLILILAINIVFIYKMSFKYLKVFYFILFISLQSRMLYNR
jgi:hypothetical protein